jgi:hypothetical protein
MKLKIIFSNDDDTLRMDQSFSVEMFKELLKTEPLALVAIIERIEKQFAGPENPSYGTCSDTSQQVIF